MFCFLSAIGKVSTCVQGFPRKTDNRVERKPRRKSDTGKSLSDQLIHNMITDCSLNYEFDTRKFPSSEHVVYTNCFLFWHSEQFMHTTCSKLGIFMYWTCKSMHTLSKYFGLVDTRISASEKNLPVPSNW